MPAAAPNRFVTRFDLMTNRIFLRVNVFRIVQFAVVSFVINLLFIVMPEGRNVGGRLASLAWPHHCPLMGGLS